MAVQGSKPYTCVVQEQLAKDCIGDGPIVDVAAWRFFSEAEHRFYGIQRYLNKHPSTRKALSAFYGVVSNPAKNALAYTREPISYVVLYEGLFQILYDFFQRLLCDPEVLPEVGDATASSPRPYPRGIMPQDARDLVLNQAYDVPAPTCVYRRNAAHLLRAMALDFVLSHEAYHIYNGHTRLVTDISELRRIPMQVRESGEPTSPLTDRTLEMDADCCAVQYVLRQSGSLVRHFERTPDSHPEKHRPVLSYMSSSPSAWLEAVLLAIGSVFFIFDGEEWWLDPQLEDAQHLPPSIRRQGALGLVSDLARQGRLPDVDAEAVADQTVQSQFQLARCIGRMLGRQPLYDAFRYASHPTNIGMSLEVLEHWKQVVRPLLVPLAHTTRLPP